MANQPVSASRPLYRVAQGAWPDASAELADALKTLETSSLNIPSAFKKQALTESRLNPAASRYLCPRNRKTSRPTLYLSLYVNTRNTLVLDFWPQPEGCFMHEGFPVTPNLGNHAGEHFHSFERYGNGYARPTNRTLHLSLNRGLASSLKAAKPWLEKNNPEYPLLRRVCALLVKDKLHRLSLQFNCYLSRELLEYGEAHYVELRDLETAHKAKSSPEEPYFRLNAWMPEPLRKMVCATRLPSEVYAFTSEYLATLPAASRMDALRGWLANAQSSELTDADLAQLLRLSDEKQRVIERVWALAADSPRFVQEASEHADWFGVFKRAWGVSDEDVYEWTLRHHPEALRFAELAPAALKQVLELGHEAHMGYPLLAHFDQKLAEHLKTFLRTQTLTKTALNAFARGLGFTGFRSLCQWAATHTLKTAAACDRLQLQVDPRNSPLKGQLRAA